jgi:hypothetical protein
MTTESLNTWDYIIRNNARNFLHYSHSHSKIVYATLRNEIDKYETINGINTDSIKRKIDQLINDEHKNNSIVEQVLCESLSQDIDRIAPQNTKKLILFEETIQKFGLLGLINHKNQKFKSLYQSLYNIDSKKMIPSKSNKSHKSHKSHS